MVLKNPASNGMTPMSLAMLWNNLPMVEALLGHKDIDLNMGAPVLIPLTKEVLPYRSMSKQ